MEPENNAHVTDEPRVFIFEDGRHAASLYQFESPITPADLTYNVDQLASSGLDTLIYFAGTEGGVVLYDSEVAQTWGDNVVKWTHSVWYRAGRNLRQLIADGCDPLQLLCERCERKGILFIAGNWVNFQGADRETDGGLGRDTLQVDVGVSRAGRKREPCRRRGLGRRLRRGGRWLPGRIHRGQHNHERNHRRRDHTE